MISNIFIEISIILLIAVIISGIMRILRQPLVIGYIITGIIVSPQVLGTLRSTEAIQTFAQLGVALLLFMVGLNLNPKTIKEVGKVSIITGLGQVFFTSIIGFFIAKALGFSTIASVYLSVALTFSSTIIIMKLLSDKGDLETLYGKISIGFLIVQDLIAIIILMIISSIPKGMSFSSLAGETLLKGIALLLGLFLVTHYILRYITAAIAKSSEFLLLFSLGWCFIIASLFSYFNFSIEAGALLAGISLSIFPYRYEMSSKLKPLRDFFIVMFFIILGSQMVFTEIPSLIIPALLLSVFILIGNPLIVLILMGILGYTKRNSFMAGLTVAQISEFSLILIAVGVNLGHLSSELLSLTTIVGLITIAGSTYMIMYADKVYPYLSKYLSIFEKKKSQEEKSRLETQHSIVIFGYNRVGFDILEAIKKIKRKVLVIDNNPDIIAQLTGRKIECRYGDADDLELLEEINLRNKKMIISTIPNVETNLLIIKRAKKSSTKTLVIVVAHHIDETLKLYEAGANYVLMPHLVGGHYMAKLITEYDVDSKKYFKEKEEHIKQLRRRKEMDKIQSEFHSKI